MKFRRAISSFPARKPATPCRRYVLLLDQLAAHISDRRVLNLIGQYLRRTSERGGSFWDFDKGISLGCPLSPLMGAFFLHKLDVAMERLGLFYIRFMDDILVLAPTRWRLREGVKTVNRVFGALDLEKHPDKTFIGRIERGFDFLGYRFTRAGLEPGAKDDLKLHREDLSALRAKVPCGLTRTGT